MTDGHDDHDDGMANAEPPSPADGDPTLTWAEDWRPEARSYLQRLAGHLEKREVSDHSVTVPIGKAKLLVVAEEVELVKALAATGREPEDRLSQLLLDGVGLRVKLLASVKSVDTAVAAEAEAVAREALDADFEHVKELSGELQAMVSQASKAGDLETAKIVAEHRRRLMTIGEVAERAVPGVSARGAVPPPLVTTSTPPQHDAKAAAAARARHLAKKGKKSGGGALNMKTATVVRLGVVAVVLGCLLGLGVVYLQNRQPELPRLSATDFRDVPGVIQVVPRSPGILVIVADEAWNRSGAPERQRAMDSVVATARAAGYTRAEIRSQSRQGLGRWDGGSKVELAP